MKLMFVMLGALSAAAAAGLTGKWSIEGDVAGHAVTMNCSVESKEDSKIGGSCSLKGSEGGETVKIAGESKGEKFQFAFTTSSGYTLTCTGTVQGDTIKGDIEVAGASGTFTGKRATE